MDCKPTQRDKEVAEKSALTLGGKMTCLDCLDELANVLACHAATERAMERAAIVGLLRDMVKWYDANDDGWSGYDRIAQGYREAIEAIEAGEHLSEAIARGE